MAAANAIGLQTASSQPLKGLVEAVKTLSSDANFDWASAIVEENTTLQKQVAFKDEELNKLIEKMKKEAAAKETTYNEMFEANQREKNKRTEALRRVSSLEATTREKENIITEQNKAVDDLKQQHQNLNALYKKEQENVARANSGIDELQKSLKSKDSLIEDMKTAGSKIKRTLTASDAKVKELERKNTSLEEKLKNDSARLQELEGYTSKRCEASEKTLYVSYEMALKQEALIESSGWTSFTLFGSLPVEQS
jgi:chromosome segregation ATPase